MHSNIQYYKMNKYYSRYSILLHYILIITPPGYGEKAEKGQNKFSFFINFILFLVVHVNHPTDTTTH